MNIIDYLEEFDNQITKTKGLRDIMEVVSICAYDDRYGINDYPDLFTLLFMIESELADKLNDLSEQIQNEYKNFKTIAN